MRAIDLNLASRPFRNNSLVWLSAVLAILVLSVITAANVRMYTENRRLAADLRQQVSTFEQDAAELERRGEQAYDGVYAIDITAIEAQADKANEFIRWKAFSWTRLFNQMQAIQPHNVQMTSIRPIFRKKRLARRNDPIDVEAESIPVTVEGLAKSLDDFFELERALMRDPHFDRIEPEATDTDENSKETVFSLRFLYDAEPDPVRDGEPEAATDEADVRADASVDRSGGAG